MTGVLPTTGADAPAGHQGPRLAAPETGARNRFSALDGIRAFAVLAVLLYHFGVSWVGGGLLGVDVFFVLSGFLITTLLCRELARTGTVRLGRFWAQRARRLLPALFVVVLGVAVYAHFDAASLDLSSVRGDAIATLLYVANWHFILSDQGYFAQAAAPSPFLHTWSLAVEEQYYLLWPLIALFVVRRWGIPKLAVTAAVGAVASAVVMVSLYAAGASVDRLYYGTDTRAQALLVGSFLGAVGAHGSDRFVILPERWTDTLRRRRLWAVPGVVGAVFLVWAWHALNGQDAVLYRGGFLAVAVATGAVIVSCVTAPASLLPRALSVAPLVFVGRISYGLYLYHWPLFLVIDHANTGLTGAGLLAARMGATFAVATASFIWLEEPIRMRRSFRGRAGLTVLGLAVVVTVVAVVVTTVAPSSGAVAADRPTGVSAAEHRSLVAVGAFTTRPVQFLVTGDSVALTLGVGLTPRSVQDYGVRILDGGQLGCDLDGVEVRLSGVAGPATKGCLNWRTTFAHGVDGFRPDVVGVLIGRWEVSDHLFDGRWVHVGDPAWDAHLVGELSQMVDILAARGAKVVLFTMPYVDPPTESANGTPFSENDPARADAFNALLAEVAAGKPGVATLIDLNRLLDPSGHYQSAIGGVTVRWPDGVHISQPGGRLLQPLILPRIGALGLTARAAQP